jgi:hypothetical protein
MFMAGAGRFYVPLNSTADRRSAEMTAQIPQQTFFAPATNIHD